MKVDAKRLEEIAARVKSASPVGEYPNEHSFESYNCGPEDARLAAHARQDVPDLMEDLLEARVAAERTVVLLAQVNGLKAERDALLVKVVEARNEARNARAHAELADRELAAAREALHGVKAIIETVIPTVAS